ncbi:MAG: ABC transporter permease [Fulvivirga sp.]|uniref:ABC transporter permease n=1 Tax=Fulvivirga sp. TaxID=1931237 RepID=UPI0032F02335
MLRNYIKITFRNLWKNRVFSAINIVGLTLGISVCLVIYLFVKTELSYDNFHSNSENTYRLLRISDMNGEKYLIGASSGPFAEALVNDFPQDIKRTTRAFVVSGLVTYEDKNFIDDQLAFADSNFLETFSFPLKTGDRQTALKAPNSMIITQKMAKKYFGDEDPINKIIKVDNKLDYVITGVFDDLRAKSHLKFDAVANFTPLRNLGWMTNWWSNGLNTYVVLNENTNRDNLEAQFPAFMDKYFGEHFNKMQNRIDITLQPLKDIYFQPEVRYDRVLHGNIQTVYIFSAIGLFIFIIACINFMNLATAKSIQRAKEVGVRKTLGSSKRQLILQFFMESMGIAFIAVLLAFMITEITLPIFNSVFSLELEPERNIVLLMALAGSTIVLTGLISGVYPAMVLSSFKPAAVLKGKFLSSNGGLSIRKILVILQFSISVFLIIFTIVIGRQLYHINNVDLGFKKDEIVLIELNYNEINQKIDAFKNGLLANTAIKDVTISSGYPGGFHDTYEVKVEGLEEQPRIRTLFTDEHYISTYDLEIVAGRNFSEDFPSDKSEAIMINETAAHELGWTPEEAISKKMYMTFGDSTYRNVIGVVNDYYFGSLKSNIEPLAIQMADWPSLMSIRVAAGSDVKTVANLIQTEWTKYVPFEANYKFLDDMLNQLYEDEQLQGKLFQFFAFISIFIASLGIFGLASYSATQRRKEIGIRKVLGATVRGISSLLAKDYVKLVAISNLVAWPVAYYAANLWLGDFVNRTSLGLDIFVVAMIIALCIALLSVFFQSFSAANANPASILKEE